MMRLSSPIDSGDCGLADTSCSTRANMGSKASRESSLIPLFSVQCLSTRSGARQVMPPLMVVLPPTQRPSMKGIGGAPMITVALASR